MEFSEERIENVRTTPLYAVLGCSIILLLIGIIMTVKGIAAGGALPGGRGMAAGKFRTISGWGLIFLSVVLGAFPLYYLRKQRQKSSRHA